MANVKRCKQQKNRSPQVRVQPDLTSESSDEEYLDEKDGDSKVLVSVNGISINMTGARTNQHHR